MDQALFHFFPRDSFFMTAFFDHCCGKISCIRSSHSLIGITAAIPAMLHAQAFSNRDAPASNFSKGVMARAWAAMDWSVMGGNYCGGRRSASLRVKLGGSRRSVIAATAAATGCRPARAARRPRVGPMSQPRTRPSAAGWRTGAKRARCGR